MYGKIPQQTIVSFVLYFTSFPTQYNCKATSRYILTQTYELTKNRRKKTTKRNDKGNDCEQTGTCRWSYHFDASAHLVNKKPTCRSPEDISWSILTFSFDSLEMNLFFFQNSDPFCYITGWYQCSDIVCQRYHNQRLGEFPCLRASFCRMCAMILRVTSGVALTKRRD